MGDFMNERPATVFWMQVEAVDLGVYTRNQEDMFK